MTPKRVQRYLLPCALFAGVALGIVIAGPRNPLQVNDLAFALLSAVFLLGCVIWERNK